VFVIKPLCKCRAVFLMVTGQNRIVEYIVAITFGRYKGKGKKAQRHRGIEA
jgi:hypothetical protein